MASLPVDQVIYSGSAQLLIADAPTKTETVVTTTINNSGSPAYTALTEELVVADADTIAPNVVDDTDPADPPIIDVLCSVGTKEIMFCYKKVVSSNTIYVARGLGKQWRGYSYADTQYSSANSVANGAYLQHLGYFTAPTRSDMVVVNGGVTVTVTQASFKTRDDLKGNDTAYTSEPSNIELTAMFPRSTLPSTARLLGLQAVTDGNTPEKYIQQAGRAPAGTKLPGKMVILIPNEVLSSLPTVTIDGNNHLDLARCIIFPSAQPYLDKTWNYTEGTQKELNITINAGFDEVWQTAMYEGAFTNFNRIAEIIT